MRGFDIRELYNHHPIPSLSPSPWEGDCLDFHPHTGLAKVPPMNFTASSVLTIDLGAIAKNYAKIRSLVLPPCEVSAVIKADAYGLGLEDVAKTLDKAGAQTFFVATIDEAVELRKFTSKKIATLNGYFRGAEKEYLDFNITPVLCSMDEIERWSFNRPCFWQVDTGMNRLGLRYEEFENAFEKSAIQPAMVLSHLACAEETNNPKNAEQLEKFSAIVSEHPLIKFSLANSSGTYLGAEYHFDLVRPGMALYGLNPTPETENPMTPVVGLETRVLQIHTAKAGETAGYGATTKFYSDATLATVSLGYADGFFRTGGNKASLYWKGYPCAVIGRVSMDLVIVDLSDLPISVLPPYAGDFMEVIGASQSADALARDLGTIGYEVLTSLGKRSHRIYKAAQDR